MRGGSSFCHRPDGIHEMLKYCSKSLAGPLSLLFQISYYNCELHNVVPVHKKHIIRDEVMLRCQDHIDQRQHGFLLGKSCGTQLLGFSVNDDIILQKLKNKFRIDGTYLFTDVVFS